MKCATCHENTPDSWNPLFARAYPQHDDHPHPLNRGTVEVLELSAGSNSEIRYSFEWMRCANAKCGEVLVRITRKWAERQREGRGVSYVDRSDPWLAVPRHASDRHTDPAVPSELSQLFHEACLILDQSPRASALLSRRLLADVLETYAGRSEQSLAERIDIFNDDVRHPYGLRKNLHHLREMGNITAHRKTDKDDVAVLVEVDRDEAEWALDVIERPFDYFIVSPGRDMRMQSAVESKIKKAGRREIPPLPEDRERD